MLIFLTSFLSVAFQSPENEGLQVSYGVLSSDPSRIELVLNKDFSFTYQDHSIPNKSVQVTGSYRVKGNKIFLESHDSETDFRDRWKIKHDGKSVVSREGMCFYILRKKTD